MKAIMIMFDSLNRHFLPNYGCSWTKMPNFQRIEKKLLTFDNFYGGSMPCMPARRELHTGRYNFLHTPWTPMQPYDDSIITRLKNSGIYTHICTDHFHYWEDGGSCYLTKFDSHELIRGQQGDPWKGEVLWPDFPETLSRRKNGQSWRHDWINRKFLNSEEKMPQAKTFEAGLEFLQNNKQHDNWFLQIETFDPHEPFYTQQEYKSLYPHDYNGHNLDWPDYGKNEYGADATKHVIYEYSSLLSMCDYYLGKIIDFMDESNLWKDTMLIINTDHGFMLGEKEFMGKNIQPFYNEIIHSPFFIYDPRNSNKVGRRKSLAQTIDIVPTLAEFFNISPPMFMDGKSLTPIIENDSPIREGALFGVFGGHVNITDGHYVYMHAPINKKNQPLNIYTLMPCNMNAPFQIDDLKNMELVNTFKFTKGAQLLKIPAKANINPYWYGTMLFDLQTDPTQLHPIHNTNIQLKMINLMKKLMIENEAPEEQFLRLGIPKYKSLLEKDLSIYSKIDDSILENFIFSDETTKKIVLIYLDSLSLSEQNIFINSLSPSSIYTLDSIINLIKTLSNEEIFETTMRQIKNFLI